MKKFLFTLVGIFACFATANAQKSIVHQQFTTSRMPDVYVAPIVKPLTVEVEVIKGADPTYSLPLTAAEVASFNREGSNQLENIHNYGIYKFAADRKADMIVAPTFNLSSQDDGSWILEIKGYPAVFKNWQTATPQDYEWMRITGSKQLYDQSLDPFKKKSNQ